MFGRGVMSKLWLAGLLAALVFTICPAAAPAADETVKVGVPAPSRVPRRKRAPISSTG